MRLGAWVMISPTWGFPPRRRQRWGESRLFSRITRSTRLRETRMPRQTRSRAQTLRCPSPSQGDASRSASMATSRASPRSRASVPGALLVGAQRWPAAGISRRTRNGQNPRPHRPAGGRRPNPCRERWRHFAATSAAPKGRTFRRLQHTCMINSPIRFMAMRSAFTGSPLRSLSEHRSRRSPSHATARAGKSPRPTAATKVPPARHAKAAGQSRLRVSTAGQVPAGLPAKPGPW